MFLKHVYFLTVPEVMKELPLAQQWARGATLKRFGVLGSWALRPSGAPRVDMDLK